VRAERLAELLDALLDPAPVDEDAGRRLHRGEGHLQVVERGRVHQNSLGSSTTEPYREAGRNVVEREISPYLSAS
jgi:hypothetical protein